MHLAKWLVPLFLAGVGSLVILDGVILAADAQANLNNAQAVNDLNCPANGPCATLSGIGEQSTAVLTEALGVLALGGGLVVGLVRVRRTLASLGESKARPPIPAHSER